jgi:hypothetical protein
MNEKAGHAMKKPRITVRASAGGREKERWTWAAA